jgi:hypothetical protein
LVDGPRQARALADRQRGNDGDTRKMNREKENKARAARSTEEGEKKKESWTVRMERGREPRGRRQ